MADTKRYRIVEVEEPTAFNPDGDEPTRTAWSKKTWARRSTAERHLPEPTVGRDATGQSWGIRYEVEEVTA